MDIPKFTKEEFDWLNRNGIFDFKDFVAKVRKDKITIVEDKALDALLDPKHFIKKDLKKDDDDCIEDK